MRAIRAGLAPLRGCTLTSKTQWYTLQQSFQALRITPISTTPSTATTPWSQNRTYLDPAGPPTGQITSELAATFAHARPLPASPSYFSGKSHFYDNYVKVQELFRKYRNLPSAPPNKYKRVAWKKLEDYRATFGEHVSATDYHKCVGMVKRLHRIHLDLMPPQVLAAMRPFMRDLNPFDNVVSVTPIDKYGRAVGVGRRKTSVARAWVVEGTGRVEVNGKTLSQAFGRIHDRESATWALRATDRLDKYNVWALVEGGGTTGQAEALTLAVAKALMAHEPALKPALRRGKEKMTMMRRMMTMKGRDHDLPRIRILADPFELTVSGANFLLPSLASRMCDPRLEDG